MTRKRKPICGVGINDVYDDCFGEPKPKYYSSWKRIFERCYSSKHHHFQQQNILLHSYRGEKNCIIFQTLQIHQYDFLLFQENF